MLSQSDFVVCLVVANEQTENLINAEAFAQMKRDAFFINLSRGNLVDEKALQAALDQSGSPGPQWMSAARPIRSRHCSGAAADVIATPHTAGLTPEAIEHQAFDTVKQVKALVAGQMPPGAVNPDAATRLRRLRV